MVGFEIIQAHLSVLFHLLQVFLLRVEFLEGAFLRLLHQLQLRLELGDASESRCQVCLALLKLLIAFLELLVVRGFLALGQRSSTRSRSLGPAGNLVLEELRQL